MYFTNKIERTTYIPEVGEEQRGEQSDGQNGEIGEALGRLN